MFHWLVLGSKMVTKDREVHRREERNPFERDIQGVASSLNKLVTWREDSLPNILLKVMRVPWAMATGNMRGKFILNMGGRVNNVVLLDRGSMVKLGRVLSSASKGEDEEGVHPGPGGQQTVC